MGFGARMSVFSALAAGAGAALALLLLSSAWEPLGGMRFILAAVVGALACWGVAGYFGLGLDNAITRLRLALLDPDAGPEGVTLPAPLKPLRAAMQDFRERVAAESQKSSTRAREVELRRSVAETELRQVESTLDALRDAVLVTDRFDELTRANESAASLLGFRLPDDLHKPLARIVKDEALLTMVKETRESESLSDRKNVEYTISGADGAGSPPGPARVFDVTLACLPDPTGAAAGGVVTILREVTREKEISQMKSDFVSQVSHELRTPLSSINAYVEMLVDGEAKDEAARAEFYEVIKNEADRLGRLIDNMLNISRIEAGIIQIERTEVDFVQVVKSAVEVMQPQARLKNITLISKAGPLVYTASSDRDMMHQVVLNLVSNAVKYTPDGGRVTVTVENDDATRSVMVSVSDTGLGIPPDAVDKVFDKFYRIDNYKRVAKGTGLGLSLVKHIVETVHGGQVGLSSTVGLGSKFWFAIPIEPAVARKAA